MSDKEMCECPVCVIEKYVEYGGNICDWRVRPRIEAVLPSKPFIYNEKLLMAILILFDNLPVRKIKINNTKMVKYQKSEIYISRISMTEYKFCCHRINI